MNVNGFAVVIGYAAIDFKGKSFLFLAVNERGYREKKDNKKTSHFNEAKRTNIAMFAIQAGGFDFFNSVEGHKKSRL
jgi:hypothetical protein